MIPLVDLARQDGPVFEDILSAIRDTARRRDFILGSALERFEERFAAYVGTRFAVGTASGGAALTLALRAVGVGPGDEVVTQPNSHASTAFAAAYLGARPVFVDVDPRTFQMDPGKLEAAVGPKTKAVLPVHMYGHAAPMREILDIAGRRRLPVIEDAAHAGGAVYHGARCGSLGTAAAFSFYPGKNLGCWGDGGAVATNDEAVAERVRLFRTYGDARKNVHTELGINARLDTLQAAVLDVKLGQLDRWNVQRRQAAAWYHRHLASSGLEGVVGLPPLEPPGQVPCFHLYVLTVPPEKREALRRHLLAGGVESGIHYPVPIHLQPALFSLGYRKGAFPIAERLADSVLSLPVYGGMLEEECRRVVASIKGFFDRQQGAEVP